MSDSSFGLRGLTYHKRSINASGMNGNVQTRGSGSLQASPQSEHTSVQGGRRSWGCCGEPTPTPTPTPIPAPGRLLGDPWPHPRRSRPAPIPTPQPAPRNIALAPFGASPRRLRRLRLAKRGIAPSRPTARCAPSLAGGGRSRGGGRGQHAGRAVWADSRLSPAPGPSSGPSPPSRLRRVGPGGE